MKDYPQVTRELTAQLRNLRSGAPEVMKAFSGMALAAVAANALAGNIIQNSGFSTLVTGQTGTDHLEVINTVEFQGDYSPSQPILTQYLVQQGYYFYQGGDTTGWL